MIEQALGAALIVARCRLDIGITTVVCPLLAREEMLRENIIVDNINNRTTRNVLPIAGQEVQPLIVIAHPTGNSFVRALLEELVNLNQLDSFHTTLGLIETSLLIRLAPLALKQQLLRRSYHLPRSKLRTYPWRESVRLAAEYMGMKQLSRKEKGWAAFDLVARELDRKVANHLSLRFQLGSLPSPGGVYCYEDCAFQTFRRAKELDLRCFYDLPIAYWQTAQKLLAAEAERLPEWAQTLGATNDPVEKLERKESELEMADIIFCPSRFVLDSLPTSVKQTKPVIISEFGSPPVPGPAASATENIHGPLRVLFAGALSQRKGLADLFGAMKLLKRADVELVVMGSLILPMDFYRQQLPNFVYEPPRPHNKVLELMRSCHVLVLPSIVEGRALVQQEAMICGLPIIVTPNAGGEDLINEGKTGFLVPIRQPEAIAAKLAWCADHLGDLAQMGLEARLKAKQLTWARYSQKIAQAIDSTFQETI